MSLRKFKIFLFSFMFILGSQSYSAVWSETSVSYLVGSDYEVGTNPNRKIVTYEHASAWTYGDNFIFIDVTNPLSSGNSNNTELYGEWSPRFSLGKMTKLYDKDRFLQDILIVGQMEHGNSGIPSRALLYGIGFDFKIPYLAFFKYSFMIRNNPDKDGSTFQSTIAWLAPFSISIFNFSFGGYLDIVHGSEGSDSDLTLAESHWHMAPQFLIDIGSFWTEKNKLHLGVEYQYWNRKFGIKNGAIENNLQWMIKWVF